MPSGVVNEINTTTGRLQRKSVLDQLRNDLLGGEVKDRALLMLDILIGLIHQVKDRMGIYIRANDILQAADLENRRIIWKLHKDFEGGVIQCVDHAGDASPGLMPVGD